MCIWRRRTISTGRTGLLYREGPRTVAIFSEYLFGAPDDPNIAVVLSKCQHWDAPFDREVLTEEDRERIRKNITEDLRGMRIQWE